jgi:ornithine cyclodeaminase
MLVLKGELLRNLIPSNRIIEAVEEAMLLYEGENYTMPPRMHAEYGGNMLLLMPSFIPSAFGTKLVTVFPENPGRQQPAIQGVMLLNDAASGTPLALMDASVLTGLRTGAVAAAAIRYLSDPGVRSLGIIGAGTQAWYQVVMASQVRSFDRIHILDIKRDRAEKLAADLSTETDAEILLPGSLEEMLSRSEVIITATTSMHPVLPPEKDLLAGKTVVAIGSFTPAMREIPEELFHLLDRVFVDSRQAREESGDLIHAIEAGLLSEDRIFTLGRLINRSIQAPERPTRFFKSVGMALYDLLVAEKIYGLAREKGAGLEIDIT